MVALGAAKYTYEVKEGWGKLPDGWTYRECAAVGVDSRDNVYVFNRGQHPMIVFDREGKFLRSWGEGMYPRAHGITIGPDDTMFCTDDGDHTVRKCTLDGRVLFTLGISGKPAPFMSGNPFNRCTHVAIDPRNGDFYVSDGYGNSRVAKFDRNGVFVKSWGSYGTGPSQFNTLHTIAVDAQGMVYVGDRGNRRIQVFDNDGNFKTQFLNVGAPWAICITPGPHQYLYSSNSNGTADFENGEIYKMELDGRIVGKFGRGGKLLKEFGSVHEIDCRNENQLYVGEITNWRVQKLTLKPTT